MELESSSAYDRWVGRTVFAILCAALAVAIGLVSFRVFAAYRAGGRDLECKRHLKDGYSRLISGGFLMSVEDYEAELQNPSFRATMTCPACRKTYQYRPVSDGIRKDRDFRPIAWCPEVAHGAHLNVLFENGSVGVSGVSPIPKDD
jgi:hypothetical protein